MPISTSGYPILDSVQDGLNVSQQIQKIRTGGRPQDRFTAESLDATVRRINWLTQKLQEPAPPLTDFIVTDIDGNVVLRAGTFPDGDTSYDGLWTTSLWIGGAGPSTAPFYTDNLGHVYIGKNLYGAQAILTVLDPYDGTAALLGTQFDFRPVTGAVDNGSGAIRLTIPTHTYSTSDTAYISDVGGVPNATGIWPVTVINANTVDLQGTYFAGTYTSGGIASRSLHITGASNSGGLIRITTSIAHGYITGDQVNIVGVGGVLAANDQWVITVIDSTHFTLDGSTFSGSYTSGGIVLRYFAGGLFETISVAGTTFENAKLRALANGDLLIRDAIIELDGTDASIILDPSDGSIRIIDVVGDIQTVLDLNGLTVFDSSGNAFGTFVQYNNIILSEDVTRVSTGPDVYALGPGPQLTLLPSEFTIQDVTGSVNVTITDAGDITGAGNGNFNQLYIGSTLIIDLNKNVTNILSIDSGDYKIDGTPGAGIIQTIMTDITFSTAVNGVFGTPGAGQSNGNVLTAVATFSTKAATFNSGILTDFT